MDNVLEIKKCRLCGSSLINDVFIFGNSALANAFKKEEDLSKEEFKAPLSYFKCDHCHSVQLKYEVSSEILFKDYLYESPPNLIPHFSELSKSSISFLNLKKDDLVLDIGSNNGILLKEYQKLGLKTIGFEPCSSIANKAIKSGVDTIVDFFNHQNAQAFYLKHGYPNLITSTNCFAHVSDLNKFVRGIKVLMNESNYFIFENAYLLKTIENNDFGQAYFEHFYMHSVIPLKMLFERHGLELFKIEYNDIQMGSIRGYVRKPKNDLIQKDCSVNDAVNNEFSFGLDNVSTYQMFMNSINCLKNELLFNLKQIKNLNKSISVYAWPAKMTLINSFFDIERYVDFIVEDSQVKIGKYAPGTKLEIKPVQFLKENPTDACIIGAYNFERDIKLKNDWYKGTWINPLKK